MTNEDLYHRAARIDKAKKTKDMRKWSTCTVCCQAKLNSLQQEEIVMKLFLESIGTMAE